MLANVTGWFRSQAKVMYIAIAAVSTAMAIYHFFLVPFRYQTTDLYQTTHLLFCLLIIFLGLLRSRPERWQACLCLAFASLALLIYMEVFSYDLHYSSLAPGLKETILGSLLLILVGVGCYLSMGWVLTGFYLAFIAYGFFGHLIPGALGHVYLAPVRLISWLSMFSGVYGTALTVSAEYIFLFILMGSFFVATGVMEFFQQVGNMVATRLRGGMGQTSMISSGLFGMVSGSVMANVAVDGPITIPAMQKSGYKPTVAAAVEAVASTGGQIMPPIMGAAAFVMAAYTGIPYFKIIIYAIIPAIAYYLFGMLSVECYARREQLQPLKAMLSRRALLTKGPIFIGVIGAITVMLERGFSPMYAAFAGVVTVLFLSLFSKETRPSFGKILQGCVDAAEQGSRVGIACAAIGPLVTLAEATGLGIKLPGLVGALSDGNFAVAAIIAGIVCIILGMGMPSVAVYVLVAIIAAPVLVQLGASVVQAHMFVFTLAISSAITPPVAVGCFVAAGIARVSIMRVGVEAMKMGLLFYFIPFLFLYNDIPLANFSYPMSQVVMTIGSLVGLIFLMVPAIQGYFLAKLNWLSRVLAVLGSGAFFLYAVTLSNLYFIVGMSLLVIVYFWQARELRVAAKS